MFYGLFRSKIFHPSTPMKELAEELHRREPGMRGPQGKGVARSEDVGDFVDVHAGWLVGKLSGQGAGYAEALP
jgi:hypothetical protein